MNKYILSVICYVLLFCNRTILAETKYDIWLENSMQRVLPIAPVRKTELTARLFLAGREYESVQIAFRVKGKEKLKGVSLLLSDLVCSETDTTIKKGNLKWYRIGYVHITQPASGFSGAVNLPTGWYPEILLPAKKFDVNCDFTQLVWLTLFVPPNTRAGEYSGQVTVQAENAKTVKIDIEATVFNFELAPGAGHLKTAFSFEQGQFERLYGKDPVMYEKFMDYIIDVCRLNPFDIARYNPPTPQQVQSYIDRGMNSYCLAYIKPDTTRQWPYGPSIETASKHLDDIKEALEQLREKDLHKMGYFLIADEIPVKKLNAEMRGIFNYVKGREPDIKMMTTAHIKQTVEDIKSFGLDGLCPIWSWTDYERAQDLRQQGLEVWTYISLMPYKPYANFRLDCPLVEARELFWQVFHQQFDGFLYWGLNQWSRVGNNALIDLEKTDHMVDWNITTGGTYSWLHGDGTLLYPSNSGPIGGIRLMNIRDGLEDYEYLWQLSDLAGNIECGRNAALMVTKGLDDITRDPRKVYSQRLKIARAIEVLSNLKSK